jgi:hypothetical protein
MHWDFTPETNVARCHIQNSSIEVPRRVEVARIKRDAGDSENARALRNALRTDLYTHKDEGETDKCALKEKKAGPSLCSG